MAIPTIEERNATRNARADASSIQKVFDQAKHGTMVVNDTMRSENLTGKFQTSNAVLSKSYLHPALCNARAARLVSKGLYQQALADLEAARSFLPRDPMILGRIGYCLMKVERPVEALAALDAAIAVVPRLAHLHYHRAVVLSMLNDTREMHLALRDVLRLDPDHIDALASRALLAAQFQETATARSYAERVLSRHPRHAVALGALAIADINDKRIEAGKNRLRQSLEASGSIQDPRVEIALAGAANAFDRSGYPSEAFHTCNALNRMRRAVHAYRFEASRAVDEVRRRTNYFRQSAAWPSPQLPAPRDDVPEGHVFLLGFMRSGTTLLETVLSTGAEVVATDEREFLADAARTFLLDDEGIDRLACSGAANSHHGVTPTGGRWRPAEFH
ncbi:MAG TPA: hypothetical protein VGI20_02875 [Rhizomicrobium sp.]